MTGQKFALGLDFGTESVRAVLVNAANGEEGASELVNYPHGVLDRQLPDNKIRLGPDWALQDAGDYLAVLKKVVPRVLRRTCVRGEQVIGIGVAFTSCTILPTRADGTPLSKVARFRRNPHAWVKLWKHHAAQPEADEINQLAEQRKERFLARYGGRISSEWLFPKALQILRQAPEIYGAADRILEAGDWMVWQLTGQESRSACHAGYKSLWDKTEGFPSADFCRTLDARFADFVPQKLKAEISPVGSPAGGLRKAWARRLGLLEGTPVGTAIIDAHAAVLGSSVAETGKMVLVMGTSTCHMMMGREKIEAPGIAGIVEDGIVPGLVGYESGQAATGDIFAWFVRSAVPPSYHQEARRCKTNTYDLLGEKATALRPGANGLLALDWWNGNRSVLMDANLSGLLVGLTLATRPEEMYRALIEATAFGTRRIIEAHEAAGIRVEEIHACGGLAHRSPGILQIYADIVEREIRVAASAHATAVGAAIIGALAAGKRGGGYDDFVQSTHRMARLKPARFRPQAKYRQTYRSLYAEYLRLHDYFGRGENPVMKALRASREEALV